MDTLTKKRIRANASTASNIASLCLLMSEALGASPETSHASEALDGLKTLAIVLSNELHEIVEEAA